MLLRPTGDTECRFNGELLVFLMKDLAFDLKNRPRLRNIKVRIEFCAAPNTTRLNVAVIGWCDFDIIRAATTVKQQRNIGV